MEEVKEVHSWKPCEEPDLAWVCSAAAYLQGESSDKIYNEPSHIQIQGGPSHLEHMDAVIGVRVAKNFMTTLKLEPNQIRMCTDWLRCTGIWIRS